MHAARERGSKPRSHLYSPPARFEARDSVVDAMFDGRVVADVEVQELQVLEASPVAPVEHAGLFAG